MYGGEMMYVRRVLLSGIFEGIKPQCNRTGRPLSNARASPKTPHYQSERMLFAPVAMPRNNAMLSDSSPTKATAFVNL